MAIPDYQSLMLPLLQLLKNHIALEMSEITEQLSNQFNLSETERAELLPSGKQAIINNRIGWAKTYLKKAGLVDSPRRGIVQITPRGENVLAENPRSIDVKFLSQFPEFANFRDNSPANNQISNQLDSEISTPEELLESTYLQLKNELLAELLEKIKSSSPSDFENMVVDVIVKMGYGGSHAQAGRALGRSGDGGVDGIINEDKLGLDVIYLQAKRWLEGNVSRPEIQKFAGALQGKRAKKGIFITTSDFTAEARNYVTNIDCKIILVSGQQLVELMWEYNIGLNSSAFYEIKKIDFEYFDELT